MKRIIVTNNKKVEKNFTGKADVILLKDASSLQVLQEGEKIALKGGKLLMDPTRKKGYFKSLVFYMEDGANMPDEKSALLLKKSIEEAGNAEKSVVNKESILTGILQNRDLNLVKSIAY
jgi:hypothetical protein